MVVSSNPSLATSFLFFSTKMITFVLCNIFEWIWYSEFILYTSILDIWGGYGPIKIWISFLASFVTVCLLDLGFRRSQTYKIKLTTYRRCKVTQTSSHYYIPPYWKYAVAIGDSISKFQIGDWLCLFVWARVQ